MRRTRTAADAYPVSYLDAGADGYALPHAYAISNLDAGADGYALPQAYLVSDVYAISNLDAGANTAANPGGCPPLDIAHGFVPLG